MSNITLTIGSDIINKFPETRVGFLLARNIDQLADLRIPPIFVRNSLDKFRQFGLTPQNLVMHPTIENWRRIYQSCGVKPKTFKSSVESLASRLLKDDYRPIHPVVDMYNYLSAAYLLPMGGYNFDAFMGEELILRYATDQDKFVGINGKSDIEIMPSHIVYADNAPDSVVCWMWNHKDSKRTMLNPDTKNGLFLVDSGQIVERQRLDAAIQGFIEILTEMGAEVIAFGKIDEKCPSIIISN